MKLGLQLGYWGAAPPAEAPTLIVTAQQAGFAAISTAESWGSDAFTPLAWWGASAPSLRLTTSVVQMSARTPAACAMHALTLDHLSGGRFTLGLGVSGPQVVEGWYGQPFAQPLARTREYVQIVRDVLAREAPVRSPGPYYPLPYRGEGATGLGKSLRPITHPLRADLPIWLGAEGPANVALAAEIADGWVAVFYSPGMAATYREWLEQGWARPGARRSADDFEVVANCQIVITQTPAQREAALAGLKPVTALYLGAMGAPEANFHANVFQRMGYGDVVTAVAARLAARDQAGAAAAIPDALIDEIAIIGPEPYVRERLAAAQEAGVSMFLVGCRSVAQIEALASLTA